MRHAAASVSLIGLYLSACSARVIEARAPARACHQQRGLTALTWPDRPAAAVCKLVLTPIAMMVVDPAQAMALADSAQAMTLVVDPAQLPVDAVVQSSSDPSSAAALATLLIGGAAVLLIGTAVEGMLGALGIGGGAEVAASAAARLTAEAVAGGADVAVGASVADVAVALEASAVAEVGVAGGAQMSEVVAIGGAQAAEVATQVAGVTDVLVDGVAASSLAAVADIVGTGVVGFAGLVAVNGAAVGLAPVGKGLSYLAALALAAWVGSLLRVAVDSVRGAVESVQSVGAAIESAGAEAIRVDAMSAMTPVDAMAPFDEGAMPDDTDDLGAYSS